jgi:hypothetical protein
VSVTREQQLPQVGSVNLALTRDEVAVILGTECRLNTSLSEQNLSQAQLWNSVATYLVNYKYAPTATYQAYSLGTDDANIRTALANLAPNQRAKVIETLSKVLNLAYSSQSPEINDIPQLIAAMGANPSNQDMPLYDNLAANLRAMYNGYCNRPVMTVWNSGDDPNPFPAITLNARKSVLALIIQAVNTATYPGKDAQGKDVAITNPLYVAPNTGGMLDGTSVANYLKNLEISERNQILANAGINCGGAPHFVTCGIEYERNNVLVPLTDVTGGRSYDITFAGEFSYLPAYSQATAFEMIFGTNASTGFVADAANPISVNPLASTPTPFTWETDDIYLPVTFSTQISVPGQAADGERVYIIRYGTQDFGPFSAFIVSPGHVPQCSNGRDDDSDGLTDFPNDPDCTSATDNSERPAQHNPNECPPESGRFPEDENVRAAFGCPPWQK